MAQYFQQPQQEGDIYNTLGNVLGGLGGYAMSTFKRSKDIQKFIDAKETPQQAAILADMSPAQQMQYFTQKMKQSQQDKKIAALSKVLGGRTQDDQNQTTTNETGDLNTNLGALGNRPAELTSQQKLDALVESGLYDLNDVEKIDKMFSRQDEAKEKRAQREEDRKERRAQQEEDRTERQQKLQRKDIHDTVKQWRNDSKKADKDLHALEELKILREDPEAFTPTILRKGLTKLGFGDFFKGKSEELYGKITEQLVFDRASELASTGKMTSSLVDRVRQTFPSLENTPEGAEIITNILGRGASEKKVHDSIYNELRKKGKWKPSQEPIDILQQVDEIADPLIEQMRRESDSELERYLNKGQPDPSKVKRYRDTETGKIMVSNGREFVPEGL